MKEDPAVWHGHEARPIAHASVDEDAAPDPDRVKHEGHGAGGVNGSGQITVGQGNGSAAKNVVRRDGHRRPTLVEAAGQEPFEVFAEEPSPEQAEARTGIPEVRAPERRQLVGQLVGCDAAAVGGRDQRPRARPAGVGRAGRLREQGPQHAGVGEKAEEPRRQGERIRALVEPLGEGLAGGERTHYQLARLALRGRRRGSRHSAGPLRSRSPSSRCMAYGKMPRSS